MLLTTPPLNKLTPSEFYRIMYFTFTKPVTEIADRPFISCGLLDLLVRFTLLRNIRFFSHFPVDKHLARRLVFVVLKPHHVVSFTHTFLGWHLFAIVRLLIVALAVT